MSDVRPVPRGVRAGCAAILLLAAAAGALANVGDPKSWKPSFDKPFQAPAPPDAEARAKAFAERNSKANLEGLATDFFTLVDLAKTPEAVRAALARGDHQAALDAYRDFFMDRLATFIPDGANLSLYTFAAEPMPPAGLGFKVEKKTDWTVATVLYPRKFDKASGETAPDLADLVPLKGGPCGFSAAVPGGGRVL